MQKISNYTPHAARLLLGLVFLVFGLNGFLGFIPQPEHTGDALTFLGGLGAAAYFFPLLKGTEVVTGLLLLSGRLVPLSLAMLAPIVLNIFLFHLFFEPATIAMPLVLLGLELFLAWSYRDSFRGVLNPGAHPARSEETAAHVPSPSVG